MSKGINLPTTYTLNTNLSGDVDSHFTLEPVTATVGTSVAITQLPAISIGITQLPAISIGITELPEIDIKLTIAPTRIHVPLTLKFALCLLGFELLSFGVCGEVMTIIEPYVPHRMERCS